MITTQLQGRLKLNYIAIVGAVSLTSDDIFVTIINMSNMRRGFTMVELLIVIAIIGILTTIGFMGFGKYQADTRDNVRANRATIISEYLEKYYNKNGEYPSCPDLTTDPNTVKTDTLKGINTGVLITPQKPTNEDNSIKCSDLTDASQGDYFAYVGDGSVTCTSGVSCLEYTIKYISESTDSIEKIDSRHQTDVKTSGNIGNLTSSATGFTSINLTWQSIDNASSYTLQRASDINFSTNLDSSSVSGLSSSITGLLYDTKYYFRVQPTASSSTGNWSNTTNSTTWSIGTPSTSISATTDTAFTQTWNSTAHAASYLFQCSTNNTVWDSSCQGTTSATTYAYASNKIPGKTYYVRVQGVNGSYNGPWSNIANATTTISAPSGTATINSTTQITESWGAISGAVDYEIWLDDNSSFSSPAGYSTTSTSRAFTGLTPGKTWYFKVRARGANTNSGWSGTDSATTTISAPVCSATTNSTTQITESCTATSGAVAYNYQVDDNSSFSSSAQYSTASTSWASGGLTPGKTWYFRVQAVGANTYSGWSGTDSATTTISAPSISASSNSMTQITASWGAVSGATSYSVYYANNSSFTGQVGYNTTSTSRAFTGLNPGTTYYFRVYSLGANTNSGWSGTASAATPNPVLSGWAPCSGAYSIRPVYNIYMRLNETAYDIASNSSTVEWTVHRVGTNNAWTGTWNQNNGHSHNVVVNGTSVKNGASKTYRYYYAYANGAYEQLYNTSSANVNTYDRGYITVAHNADGAKTISASVSDSFGGQTPGNASCSINNYVLSDLR